MTIALRTPSRAGPHGSVEPATSYHLGFAVPDLSAAARRTSEAIGVRWRPTRDGRLGPWDYRITFSLQGPP